ncbi:MAG TPA: helix-turn-helix domain-containing protein [Acidimicrobiia bacterium]|nr:helix-turn-helix domain-containing protein [Acidimicrobiia bacterium]
MALPTMTAEAESLSPAPTESVEDRAVRATLACVARHGLAKTTFDDVAREAGCARATLYRYFGGKRQLVRITIAREAARIAAGIRAAADAEQTFEDAVVAMFVRAARELRENQALLFLFAFEPELVLPHVTFDAGNRFLIGAGAAISPALGRFLPADRVERAGEWLARVALTHALSPTSPIDLTDEAETRALVRGLVLPGLLRPEPTT